MTVNALLVGGPADIRRDQEAHLEPEGVCVLDHWTYDKKRGGAVSHRLPKRTQLVVLVRDMMGHRHSLEVVKLAKRQGVPVVYGTRKWSETRPLIIAALAKLPHAAAPEAPEPVSEWDVLDQEVAEQEPLPKSPELIAADAAQCAAVDLLLTAIELALVAPKTDPPAPPGDGVEAAARALTERISVIIEARVSDLLSDVTSALRGQCNALSRELLQLRSTRNSTGAPPPTTPAQPKTTHKRSPEARQRMAAAQRRRDAGQTPLADAMPATKTKKAKRPYRWKSEANRQVVIERLKKARAAQRK